MILLAALDRAGVQVDLQQVPGESLVLRFTVPAAPGGALASLLQQAQVPLTPGQAVKLDVVALGN
jgi:hypothetical protein